LEVLVLKLELELGHKMLEQLVLVLGYLFIYLFTV